MTYKINRCYLGEIDYYEQCKLCSQFNQDKPCYKTKRQVKEHIKGFFEMFDLNKLDSDTLEDVVELHKLGMEIR